MHIFMLSSSCKSPISYCMLPFNDLQLNAEHELKGGGVALPRGPSINQFCRVSSAGVMPAFVILLALIARLVFRFAVFSLHEPLTSSLFARHLCTFSLESPVINNDCIHHTCKFRNFVCDLICSMHFG